jgi:hypothetical protein
VLVVVEEEDHLHKEPTQQMELEESAVHHFPVL